MAWVNHPWALLKKGGNFKIKLTIVESLRRCIPMIKKINY
jgi:hypothetical protein